MKNILYGAIFIYLIVRVIDYQFADLANRRIIARDADFEESVSLASLDWNGPRQQACRFSYELFIYMYQTCFFLKSSGNSDDISEKYFVYSYKPPTQRLAIFNRGDDKDDYYFTGVSGGSEWKIIWYSGKVVSLRG